ncbi:MAG: hypothetical protein GF355_12635, partial [Candidatus Eisenbacteria bacterium]|nr:hypothetical protein [Candidatus Eisenbacteria bacterium]
MAHHRVAGALRAVLGLALLVLTVTTARGGSAAYDEPVVYGSGPFGGHVRSVAPAGSNGWILWTDDAGPFVRAYGAGEWRSVASGLPETNGRILTTALTACASQPNVLVAAFLDGWVFRSETGGETWSPMGSVPVQSETVRNLALHPGDPTRIL